MRSAIHAASVSLFLLGVPGCRVDPTATEGPVKAFVVDTTAPRQLVDEYESCPLDAALLAALTCATYHLGSTVNQYCGGGACFEMSDGGEVRVVAADERGSFPRMWLAWFEGTTSGAGDPPCNLTDQRHKTRVEIPDGSIRCRADLTTAQHVYYEHFLSDPVRKCLGWVECKAP